MEERILIIINDFCGGKKSRFSSELGITTGNLSNWISGRSQPANAIQILIAEKYGVSLEWLQTGTGEMMDPNRKQPEIDIKQAIKAVAVPVLAKVPCGYPREAITDDFVEDYVLLPNVKNDHFIVLAVGDSMDPTIRDGDYVLVRPQPSADHMDIVVANDPFGAVTIKRFKKLSDEKFALTYDNNRYQGMVMDINGEWAVIGRVVKVISMRNV